MKSIGSRALISNGTCLISLIDFSCSKILIESFPCNGGEKKRNNVVNDNPLTILITSILSMPKCKICDQESAML